MLGNMRNKKIWLAGLLAAFVLLVLILLFTGFRLKTVTVTGNSYYTEDEIKELIFSDHIGGNTLFTLLGYRFGGQKDILFIERYEIDMVSPTEVRVTVYEKNVIGYIQYMGSNMYFDRDGSVIESSDRQLEGVPRITGLSYSRVVLYEKLDVGDDRVFDEILALTQLLDKLSLKVDEIHFDEAGQAVIWVDKIEVVLGEYKFLDGKLGVLASVLPKMKGMEGTLYLDEYQENDTNGTYVFRKADKKKAEEDKQDADGKEDVNESGESAQDSE